MLPHHITDQVWFLKSTWYLTLQEIHKYSRKDYLVTEIEHTYDGYTVVMSQGTGWTCQKVVYGQRFPEDEVNEAWHDGYMITNIIHADDPDTDEGWIVFLAKGTEYTAQSYFCCPNGEDFQEYVHQAWGKNRPLTSIAFAFTEGHTICGVASNFHKELVDQQMKYFRGKPSRNALYGMISDGRVITDICCLDEGYLVISASNTSFVSQKILGGSWERIMAYNKGAFLSGLYITTISYGEAGWIVVLSNEPNDDDDDF